VIQSKQPQESTITPPDAPPGMAYVAAGRFLQGSDLSPNRDARPAHIVQLDAFWIDAHEVTNEQFATFVDATGYKTTAEELGYSYVFDPTSAAWNKVNGADWRHPAGPTDSLSTKQHFPVVHVSWFDATAYARWSGKELPTEAQWERAARGSLHDMPYPWGNHELDGGRRLANYWRSGVAPNDVVGSPRAVPVAQFAPNGLGLYDVAGNVWEWCGDWYAADAYQRGDAQNPTGPDSGNKRIARGGSWVGSDHGPAEIMVHHRGHFPPAFSANHLGFRCVRPKRDQSPGGS
ncbi:MAG: formylglycine-generating enzyme family protein, partial [Pirellulales bacterium]|nr:formylglycine-generating enzyme family protein [Pirellulales bacterium]